MGFQSLRNLATLQVPDIHLVVLTTGHDPFPACNTEAGCDAVLLVSMTRVRFQTPGRVIIPETDRTVVRRRQNVFRIG